MDHKETGEDSHPSDFPPKHIWRFYFGLSSLEALICLVILFTIPADANKAFFLGFSTSRLILIVFLFTAHMVCAWMAFRPDLDSTGFINLVRLPTGKKLVLGIAAIVALSGGAISLIPSYAFGRFSSYHIRFLPIAAWLALFAVQLIIVFYLHKKGITWIALQYALKGKRSLWLPVLLFFFGAVLIWCLIAATKLGLQPDLFWDKAGMPMMNWQVLASLALAVFTLLIAQKLRSPFWLKWGNVFLFILIWLITAFTWVSTPQSHSHFAPGPFPPNQVFYPYSDAMVYDSSAQLGLIGAGMDAGRGYVDKPLYTAFLLWLHALSAENFNLVVILQVVSLAVFPSIMFLLGLRLLGRAAGVAVAVLSIFKVQNAIGGSLLIWTVSHPKLLMSEFPLAVLLVLFTYFVLQWLRFPSKWSYCIAAVGCFGLSTLVRHNSWLLLPVLPFAAIWIYRRRWRTWMQAGLLMAAVLLITVGPWMVRNSQMVGTPFYFLTSLKGTVWKNRYLPEIQDEESKKEQPVLQNTVENSSQNVSFQVGGIETQEHSNSINRLVFTVVNHFAHNLVSTALVMPSSIVFNDLAHIVQPSSAQSLWDAEWDGAMTLPQSISLGINLLLISIGLGYAWKNHRLAGLLPFLVYLIYNLATAVARTSGGRYIVPAEWGLYFYYGLGLMSIILPEFPFTRSNQANRKIDPPSTVPSKIIRSGLLIIVLFGLVGLAVSSSDQLFPSQYPTINSTALIRKMAGQGVFDRMGFRVDEVKAFMQSSDMARVSFGRAIYPRYLDKQNDPLSFELYNDLPEESPNFTFRLLRQTGVVNFFVPVNSVPERFPDNSDVLVLGCKNGRYIEAKAIAILESDGSVFIPIPPSELACPATH